MIDSGLNSLIEALRHLAPSSDDLASTNAEHQICEFAFREARVLLSSLDAAVIREGAREPQHASYWSEIRRIIDQRQTMTKVRGVL